MASFWQANDCDGNIIVTIEDDAIRSDEELVAWARKVPNMHWPRRNDMRLIFTVSHRMAATVGQLVAKVIERIKSASAVATMAPAHLVLPVTEADLGRFSSGALQLVPPRGAVLPPRRGENWQFGS